MIAVGEKLPSAMLATLGPDGPEMHATADLFAGKRAVLFGVPGAFTPTCSARHLPGFSDRAADLAAQGVALIACTSVNDVFVMEAWRKSQNIDGEVMMLADGNCGSPCCSPNTSRSEVIRLCSCAVTASPALTTAMIADRLALV